MRRGLLYQVHIPYDPGHDVDGLNFGMQNCSFEFHIMHGLWYFYMYFKTGFGFILFIMSIFVLLNILIGYHLIIC